MKVLITGITGFAGSHLADYCCASTTSRSTASSAGAAAPRTSSTSATEVTLHECDLRDATSTRDVIESVSPRLHLPPRRAELRPHVVEGAHRDASSPTSSASSTSSRPSRKIGLEVPHPDRRARARSTAWSARTRCRSRRRTRCARCRPTR